MTTSQIVRIDKLHFDEGIPGFLDLKFFRLEQEDQGSPFFSLVSLEDKDVSFWLVDPFCFFSEYEFTLKDSHKQVLELKEDTPLSVLNILTVRSGNLSTVNLKAPIIINMDNSKAKQVILEDDRYEVRHPLVPPFKQEK
jgi:flagellar assembly factor FliW